MRYGYCQVDPNHPESIENLVLDGRARHRLVPVLLALKFVYTTPRLRDQILDRIHADVSAKIDPDAGRPGMTYWTMLVLAAVKFGCDFTYDLLQQLVENDHRLQILTQLKPAPEPVSLNFQTIRDNVCLIEPETLQEINHALVAAGHALVPDAAEDVRGDSFVVETNVHYPTESSLLRDGLQKLLDNAPQVARNYGLVGWRQHRHLHREVRQAAREADQVPKGRNYAARLKPPYRRLLELTEKLIRRTQVLIDVVLAHFELELDGPLPAGHPLWDLVYWQAAVQQVAEAARRRVLCGEEVPHREKLFSLFEPDTELLVRGKRKEPVQFGHLVLVMEDRAGLICHYEVMRKTSDVAVIVPAVRRLQDRLGDK